MNRMGAAVYSVVQEAQDLCLEESVGSCFLSFVYKYACTHVMQVLRLNNSSQLQAYYWLSM